MSLRRGGEPGGRMPLRAHLRELRRRLFLAALGVLAGSVLGWYLYEPIFKALERPILVVAQERQSLIALNFQGIAGAFDMQVKVSVFLGVLVSSPWWIYQLWAFVTPGLTRRERVYTFAFVGAAVPLFLGGTVLAWWALPRAVRLLTSFTPQGAANLIDAQTYLTFVMQIMLAFGLAFLLPVLIVALNFAGIGRASTWRKGWRWAVMIAFVFAAVMTPTPDAVTMIAVALPICALYFIAVGVATIHDRRLDRARVAAGLPKLDGTVVDTPRSGE